MEVLLINRDDVIRYTSLRGNIDFEKILPHIKTSQDVHLQPVIGTALLTKCKDIVEAGTIDQAVNLAYKTLIIDYIAPTLVYQCMVDYLPFAVYEIANGGIYKHTGENTTPIETAELNSLVQRYKDKAEFYGSRMEDYIRANNTDFPEFSQLNDGELPASGQDTFHGWVM